jgi:hypothetical protein
MQSVVVQALWSLFVCLFLGRVFVKKPRKNSLRDEPTISFLFRENCKHTSQARFQREPFSCVNFFWTSNMAMRTHRSLLGAEGQLVLARPVAAQNPVQNHVLQTPFNSPNARIGFRGMCFSSNFRQFLLQKWGAISWIIGQ